MKILIVGGVAGGASAAARMRRLNEDAEIIMFEKGDYISYANCGLPYYIGGEIRNPQALTLQTPESFKRRFNIDVRTLQEVVSIDRELKEVVVRNHSDGGSYRESYDQLILSPGAEPIKPGIKGIESSKVFTLRNIPDTFAIKNYIQKEGAKKAVVVGGGYIGVEMAENLTNAGLEVTVVEMQNQLIAPLDFDMAVMVHRYLKSQGVELLLNTEVQGIEDAGQELHVQTNEGELIADLLIMAIGVRPESQLAREGGLSLTERGAISVDEKMQTSDESIYAIGDAVAVSDFVTGKSVVIPLAGPANKQGRIVADRIYGEDTTYGGTQGSAILKVFDLTVATTGINERMAKSMGYDYDKVFIYPWSHATYYPEAQQLSIKAVFEKGSGKILGAQFIGFEGCDKRCDVLATAMRFGATAKDLTQLELCYAPPYSSAKDPINMLGYVIENVLTGKVKNFHWEAIPAIEEDAIRLDVRSEGEYLGGHIDGFINIPLDTLRENLDQLDKSKKVYVTCQVGLRGYLACRILRQKGFDCYNLSGGYQLYSNIYN